MKQTLYVYSSDIQKSHLLVFELCGYEAEKGDTGTAVCWGVEPFFNLLSNVKTIPKRTTLLYLGPSRALYVFKGTILLENPEIFYYKTRSTWRKFHQQNAAFITPSSIILLWKNVPTWYQKTHHSQHRVEFLVLWCHLAWSLEFMTQKRSFICTILLWKLTQYSWISLKKNFASH